MGGITASKAPPEPCIQMGLNLHLVAKRKPHQMVWLSFWQRMRDSNPRKRSQSPVCYRYTNPLSASDWIYYMQKSRNVKHYFSKSSIFFSASASQGQGFPARTSSFRYRNVSCSPFSASMVSTKLSCCRVFGCISAFSLDRSK